MATWPINELSGLLDPNVYVTGYTPTGVDVGADIAQVLNKANEVAVGANELKVSLDAGVVTDAAHDAQIAALLASLTTAFGLITANDADIATNAQAIEDLEALRNYVKTYDDTTDVSVSIEDAMAYRTLMFNGIVATDQTITLPAVTAAHEGLQITIMAYGFGSAGDRILNKTNVMSATSSFERAFTITFCDATDVRDIICTVMETTTPGTYLWRPAMYAVAEDIP